MKALQRAMLPDDENGAVLRQMLDDGDDLSRSRDIAFVHVFAEQAQAEAFVADVAALDDLFITAPEQDEEGVWEVSAVRHMPASHAAIGELEAQLAERAQAAGGYPDGWHCDGADTGDA